jgi:hypothetical protein
MPTFHPSSFEDMRRSYDEEMVLMYEDDFLTDLYNAFTIAKKEDPNCDIGDIQLSL